MRVLFACSPSHVHFWPIVPLAGALQAAGHEVRVASNGRFASSVTAAGLTAVQLGEETLEEARMRPDARPPARPEEVLRYADAMGLDAEEREHWIAYYQWLLNAISDYGRADLPYGPELVRFARAWQPDLVVWDPTFACGAVAAKAGGAAHARMLIGSDYLAFSLERLAARREQVEAAGLDPNPQAELIRPLAEKFDVEVDDELLFGQWTIDPMPSGLTLPTSTIRVPMRWIPYTGASPLPDWLWEKPQRPRVALSLGESTRRFIKGDWGRSPKIIEAAGGLDIDFVGTLNTMQLEGMDRFPGNVQLIEWVTLTQLVPTCSALIHHGGIGTFASTIPGATPQIVCDTDDSLMMQPVEVDARTLGDGTYTIGVEFGVNEEVVPTVTTWDLPNKKLEAPLVSRYVRSRGAGERLDHTKLSVAEIRDMIAAVVEEDRYKLGAEAMRDEWLAMPSPAGVVGSLERLAAAHRS